MLRPRTTLVALAASVITALIGIAFSPGERQRQSVAILESRGVVLYASRERRAAETWLAEYGLRDYFDNVIGIEIRDETINEPLITAIASLRETEDLNLSGTNVSDRQMRHLLQSLRHLKALSLADTLVTDDAFFPITGDSKLVSLNLFGTQVGNDGASYIAKAKHIYQLDVSYSQVDDLGAAHFAALPQLQHLGLEGTKISGTCLRGISRSCKLKYLNVSYSGLTDEGVDALRSLTSLKVLDIRGTALDLGTIQRVVRDLSDCEVLHDVGSSNSAIPSDVP